ncbi:hypothetical protein FACS189429_8520 [Bacteroidia bacterium]|nr:hypothetical protein FACS189429_8520 [Bacteroidia bacterium]
MKTFSKQQSKIFGLTAIIVACVTYSVFAFEGDWVKSIMTFFLAVMITEGIMMLIMRAFRKKDNNEYSKTYSKKQIWIQIIVNAIIFPIIFGIGLGLLKTEFDYLTVSLQRIGIAILLSLIAAVIVNLLFVKEFRAGSKKLDS